MENETHDCENTDGEIDEDDLYELYKWALTRNNYGSVSLKANSNIYMI